MANELERLGIYVCKFGRRIPPLWNWPEDHSGLVVCCGSYGPKGDFSQISTDEWRAHFETNLLGQLEDVRRFIRMLDGRPGRIVLMSGAGIGSGNHPAHRVPYTVCKAALVHFVEAVAPELPNVAINAVAPGPVLSKMTEGELDPKDAVSPELCAKFVGWLMTDERAAKLSGRLFSVRYDQEIENKVLGGDDYQLRRFVP